MQKPSYEQAERQEKIRIERALLRAMTIERSSIVWEREINKLEVYGGTYGLLYYATKRYRKMCINSYESV